MNTGTTVYRNYFPIKFGLQCDIQYGKAVPVFRKLMYPGDVFKIHADLLIRYQPMFTPPMNDCVATVRFGFVPLRLIEQNTELIVTGSKDGVLSTETIPTMDSVFKYLNLGSIQNVQKHSIMDYLYQIPDLTLTSQLLSKLENDKASPAAYFAKAYYRFWWDYYRDENLFISFNDFESFWQQRRQYLHYASYLMHVNLKKDRITSSLPWQLKAVAAPTISIVSNGTFTPNYGDFFEVGASEVDLQKNYALKYQKKNGALGGDEYFTLATSSGVAAGEDTIDDVNELFSDYFNSEQSVSLQSLGFNAAQFREMMAQTRIFERLARCGSRYTEYLKANFGIAPADGTLQRSQYLGGFKTRIVTTEVIQTAGAGEAPVGTLRGHGITHGTSTIKPFMAKEIGVIIGILDVKPEVIYAQGVDRELTVRSRFDFLNPSFQHLSEQEVRKGEVFFDVDTDSDGNLVNSETWGFQPYAQELRTGIKHVAGEMRGSLSAWTQALIFSSRPSLNSAFITASNHNASFNRPFVANSSSAFPMLVDFGGLIEAYRPLVKSGVPGLVDHN